MALLTTSNISLVQPPGSEWVNIYQEDVAEIGHTEEIRGDPVSALSN